jgi:hypothetical protein
MLFMALLVLILCAFPFAHTFSSAAASGGQAQPRNTVRARVPPAVAKEQVMPFRVGETLNYRVSWSAFSNAASVQLSVPEKREVFGWHTWHFRGVAHTLSTVRTLFPIDDQFDSYTDAMSLESRQFETHLNELGKTTNQVQDLVATGQKSRAPGPIVMVIPGSRDALGVLYELRSIDWQHTPEFRAPVYEGRDMYEMRASAVTGGETVRVEAGTFLTERISVRVFQYEKEVPTISFTMWISADAARTPVAMEAALPFGTLRAELTSSQ